MRRRARNILIAISVGILIASLLPFIVYAAPYAFVSNYGYPGNFVAVFDMATNTIVGSPISVGGEPLGVVVNPTGTRAYVANSASDYLTVINAETRAVIGDAIPVGDFPVGVAITPDGGKVYVTNFSSNSVSVISTATNTVVKTLYVGNEPFGIAVNPLAKRAYVACSKSDISAIYIINTETDTVYSTPLYVGANPRGVVVSPDGNYVYVSNSGGNSVSVIDAGSATELTKISTPYTPVYLAISPDGSRLYVAARESDDYHGRVYVINTATRSVIGSPIAVGVMPMGLGINAAGTRLYVADGLVVGYTYNGTVSIIDTAVNSVINSPIMLGNVQSNMIGIGPGANPTVAGVIASPLTDITYTTATAGGTITSDGGASVTARGVCWSGSANPTIADSHTSNGSGTGTFSASIIGLQQGTAYHSRVYAINSAGIAYGADISFTTPVPVTFPVVTTTSVTGITSNTAASGGNVTADGGSTVIARGVCWSTSANPTTANSCTNDGSGTGAFYSFITGLTANTPFHVRAYATNSAGTSYGSDVSFTTLPPPPNVTTASVTGITSATATSGGNVTSDGGATVTARGVCWSTSANPTTADSHSSDGTGTGSFVSSITGLLPSTPYHVRAYATNAGGTSYGEDRQFTTTTDTTLPEVTAFAALTTSNSWNISITLFTASDAGGSVTGYCVTSSNSSAGCSWSATAPGSFSVSADGDYTLYPWARDGAGNVSALFTTPVGVTVDTTAVITGPWQQKAKMTASDGAWGDSFGIVSLSADGNTALVGTFYNNTQIGAAYIFVRSSAVWVQQAKLTASDGTYYDRFGWVTAISADGNTAIIGAYQKNSSQGAAYVFTRSGTSWSQQQKLVASDGAASDYFGHSAAISSDGNSVIIGAHGNNSIRGAAYLFTRAGAVWTERKKFTASDGAVNDQFGVSVALSGDGGIALIGAWGRTSFQGAAYLFTGSGSTWTEQTVLTASPVIAAEHFGYPVVLSSDGGTALIGTYNVGNAAYIFTGSGASWTQQARLVSSDLASGDGFGITGALDVDGNTAIVGAYAKNSARGAAYVFKRDDSTWTEVAKPMGSDVANGDWFGRFVALSGDGSTALIGAYQQPLNGNLAVGSAYLFSATTGATVTTGAVTSVTATSASGGGNVLSDSGLSVTAKGLCWGTALNPTLSDNCFASGSGTGTFTGSITGLTQGAEYHVRAYATNAAGTEYGNEVIFYTDFPLSVTIQGPGVGSVNSSPPDINCSGGICNQTYPYNSDVTLTSTPGLRSVFGGWQGSCSNLSGPCVVAMDAIRAVLANFNVDPASAVWNDPGSNYYDMIGTAYQSATSGVTVIKSCRVEITENLNLNMGKIVTLSGGWNSDYNNNSGLTTVKGTVTIGTGTVTVGNLAVR